MSDAPDDVLPATRVEGESGDWVAWFDGTIVDRYQYRADAISHVVGRSHNTPGQQPLRHGQVPVIARPGAGEASGISSRHA